MLVSGISNNVRRLESQMEKLRAENESLKASYKALEEQLAEAGKKPQPSSSFDPASSLTETQRLQQLVDSLQQEKEYLTCQLEVYTACQSPDTASVTGVKMEVVELKQREAAANKQIQQLTAELQQLQGV